MAGRGVTRRRLIGGAAVGAAGATLPEGASAARRKRAAPRRRRADVVVVGAGLAGLAAARAVVAAGRTVVVLEARDRVGGRTWTREIAGLPFDVGGQWIKTRPSSYGPVQERLLALAKDVNVETFPSYYDGDNVHVDAGGNRTEYPPAPTQELPPNESLVDAIKTIAQLDLMAGQVPVEAPWTAPNAGSWDAQTAENWIQLNALTPRGKNLLRLGVQSILSCEARDVSLLYLLFYIASAGTLENLISTPQGAQESRFVGGAQTVSRRVADVLGRRVVLRSPARRIEQRGNRVVVESDRAIVTARRAIVALAPALVDRIAFSPSLPPLRAQLSHRMPLGSVIKIQALYDEPFWRADGLTGFSIGEIPPAHLSWDNSPAGSGAGALMTFIEGHDARVWASRPAAERREAVLRWFQRVVGVRALRPTEFVEVDWSAQQWSRGCYVGYAPPGVLSDYGSALRVPVGRVHWAGTETATRWVGYMDGAVQSGERAAQEALDAL